MTTLKRMLPLPQPPAARRTDFLDALGVRAHTWSELVKSSSKDGVSRAVASGRLVRLAPGVYASAAHARGFEVRADAALKWAGPGAVLAGRAALFVWGFSASPPERIDVLLPGGSHKRAPAWIHVRTTQSDVPRTELRGLAVLTPAAAVVDGFGRVTDNERGDLVFRAVRSRRASATQIQKTLAEAGHVKKRRQLVRRVDAAVAGAMSPLEEHGLRSVFNRAEFARFIRQHEVVIEGYVYYLDMFDPVTRTAVELDGKDFHDGVDPRERDIRRDAHLATAGILTLRFSGKTLRADPQWCRFITSQALRAREGPKARLRAG